jgi:ribosomal protein L12E/L44/L45/RPP1/RPP2
MRHPRPWTWVVSALIAAIEHRDLQPWLSKPRTAEEAVAPATVQTSRVRGERDRDRDRDRERDRDRRSGVPRRAQQAH